MRALAHGLVLVSLAAAPACCPTVWGVIDEGGTVLWLRDCAVVPDR